MLRAPKRVLLAVAPRRRGEGAVVSKSLYRFIGSCTRMRCFGKSPAIGPAHNDPLEMAPGQMQNRLEPGRRMGWRLGRAKCRGFRPDILKAKPGLNSGGVGGNTNSLT